MMKINHEKETISKEHKQCISTVSTRALESSDFLIQTKANNVHNTTARKVYFLKNIQERVQCIRNL